MRRSSNGGGSVLSMMQLGNDESPSILDRMRGTLDGLKQSTWEDAEIWIRSSWRTTMDRSRRLFLFLTGEPLSSTTSASEISSASDRDGRLGRPSTDREEESGGFWTTFTGVFSGLGRSPQKSSSNGFVERSHETFDEGEVHADLVKDDKGNFIWRYLLVDLPSTSIPSLCFSIT